MPSATAQNEPARIPAWKRLGLQLKSQTSPESALEPAQIELSKRKREDAIDNGPTKKSKPVFQLTTEAPVTPIFSRKKSVTFTPETKVDDGDSIKQLFNSWVAEQKSQDPSFQLQNSQPALRTPEASIVEEQVKTTLNEKDRRAERVKKPKQEKGKASKSAKPSKIVKPASFSSRPYLQYLRQYHESRGTWKFNKNHQTHLLKHVFDIDIIPSDHAHLICPYVRGLQGGVRTRLRDAALAIKVEDQEKGSAGFPDNMADPEKKQREYDAALQKYVQSMTASNASSTVGYEEGVLLGLSDANMAKRVAKRTRAEQILAELEASQDASEIVDKGMVNGDNDSQKRLRMNDGSTQKVARRRKQRTATIEDDSSSSDSDDSGNDSSDDSVTENDEADDTSSSSSSSSSESASDEEDSEEDSQDSSEDSEDDDD
ncbi:hypothetical protein L207DRAFT_509079 [Hyaloscypha variabilis F]|uniref:WKF domain-containing protein n=1 Tax=Hyaloscypha variabilis (strain UAMH 11265 / GT02V1 / F) TaxID=1149755 RepID=A0A2J6S0M2_HYAVF|nr:hypothetical protein L207DRAFT_509079 [Hyaloscypha variabilis F]